MGVLRGERKLSPVSKYGTKPRPGRKMGGRLTKKRPESVAVDRHSVDNVIVGQPGQLCRVTE